MFKQKSPEEKSADSLRAGRGDGMAVRQLLEQARRDLLAAEVLVVTGLPRGSLQLAQPAKLPESIVRAYARGAHSDDRLTWTALREQRTLTAEEAFGADFLTSDYFRGVLAPLGLRHAAAAPLKSPVLEGYPGAVHAYRTVEQGQFTSDELEALSELAKQIDEQVAKARAGRRGVHSPALRLTPRPAERQFVFDRELREIYSAGSFNQLDERLQQQLREHASKVLHNLNGQAGSNDRLQIPDSRGDIWVFRAVTYRRYPALGDGAFVIFSLQPNCPEWSTLRPSDFQADPEVARLIPALRFMAQEFHRSPTLGEISQTVHLSPFHFHRRFTELLGITPKHFLLECQIHEAKQQLLARRKDLAQIAVDCGFAHQSHFTSRFKQATGLTPTRWRRLASEAQRNSQN